MKLKLTKIRPQDLGVVRHQLIPRKYKGKKVSLASAEKEAKRIAKELGYKEVLFYQESEESYEFRLVGRDKKWQR